MEKGGNKNKNRNKNKEQEQEQEGRRKQGRCLFGGDATSIERAVKKLISLAPLTVKER